MKFSEALVLLAAGTLGGIFSTVVSIASLVTYPALLALGVPPLSANMTNTVSLVLAGAGDRPSPGEHERDGVGHVRAERRHPEREQHRVCLLYTSPSPRD